MTGPESNCLNVSGKFNAKLKTKDYCADQDIYVVKELTQSLLGWPAICVLHVFANINPIIKSAESVKSLFPEMFLGLGKLGEPYTIKLKPKTKSFCLGTPRRIPLPEVESSRTSLASRTSSRTHFEVLGLEAPSPRKLPCPRLEDSTIFEPLKFFRKTPEFSPKICKYLCYFALLEHRLSQAGLHPPIEISPMTKM